MNPLIYGTSCRRQSFDLGRFSQAFASVKLTKEGLTKEEEQCRNMISEKRRSLIIFRYNIFQAVGEICFIPKETQSKVGLLKDFQQLDRN